MFRVRCIGRELAFTSIGDSNFNLDDCPRTYRAFWHSII
jgi:hypothetical protein